MDRHYKDYQVVLKKDVVALAYQMPAPPSRPPAQVLDEDSYLEYLEYIIKRDYFPDLFKYETLKTCQAKGLRPPTALLTDREEGRDPVDRILNRDKDVDVTGMRLDEYLRRYTSEDNSSF